MNYLDELNEIINFLSQRKTIVLDKLANLCQEIGENLKNYYQDNEQIIYSQRFPLAKKTILQFYINPQTKKFTISYIYNNERKFTMEIAPNYSCHGGFSVIDHRYFKLKGSHKDIETKNRKYQYKIDLQFPNQSKIEEDIKNILYYFQRELNLQDESQISSKEENYLIKELIKVGYQFPGTLNNYLIGDKKNEN